MAQTFQVKCRNHQIGYEKIHYTCKFRDTLRVKNIPHKSWNLCNKVIQSGLQNKEYFQAPKSQLINKT